jgi:hypothetical protein
MKVLTRLGKLLVIAAFVVYMCAPGAVSPSVSADDGGHCYENFVFCQGPPPCDCPIGNCSGCFIKSGEPGCGICSGDVIIQ